MRMAEWLNQLATVNEELLTGNTNTPIPPEMADALVISGGIVQGARKLVLSANDRFLPNPDDDTTG